MAVGVEVGLGSGGWGVWGWGSARRVLSYLLAVDEDPAVEGARLVRLRGRVRIRVRVRVRLRVRVRVRG